MLYSFRYSLSDDEYTNLGGNVSDETKFDSESGYLSYHRFNSNEGAETNGENTHHRHNSFQNDEDNEDDTAILNHSAVQSPNEIPPGMLTIPNGGIHPEYGRRTRHRNNNNSTNFYNNHPTGGIVRANGANARGFLNEAPLCVSDCDEGACKCFREKN